MALIDIGNLKKICKFSSDEQNSNNVVAVYGKQSQIFVVDSTKLAVISQFSESTISAYLELDIRSVANDVRGCIWLYAVDHSQQVNLLKFKDNQLCKKINLELKQPDIIPSNSKKK